ncbi:MAG: precorrin-6y C5,15-methyltransferase (decarboxylating) subunit CbiE [Chloroflexota bacterium]
MSDLTAVTVIGLGPEVESLSCEASSAINEADVLAGGKRQLARFEDETAERIVLASDIEHSGGQIRLAAEAGTRGVVLASGDPLLFGIGATLVRELGREQVRILPGVSSVQMAFARVGEPWHDATVLSAHGRPLADVLPQAVAATKLAILTDGVSTPSAIADALLEAGIEDCRAVVCENLGEAGERITDVILSALPGQQFAPLNVLLVFRQPGDARLRFGQADEEFESIRGQITKAEVRAVTLSKLRLAPHGVLWDIGAGCGSVAIEAARLMPRGGVYAIERDPEQLACLRRNVARHHASNVHVVAGEAPEALAGLPEPRSVFIGGSGERLSELLDKAPRPFVVNLAILEHVSLVLHHFPQAEVAQVSVARSGRIGDGHRLLSLNPVYVVSVPA